MDFIDKIVTASKIDFGYREKSRKVFLESLNVDIVDENSALLFRKKLKFF